VEHRDVAVAHRRELTHIYNNLDGAAIAGRFDSGPFRLIMDHTPPTSTCIAVWGRRHVQRERNQSRGGPADEVGFAVFQLTADFLLVRPAEHAAVTGAHCRMRQAPLAAAGCSSGHPE
jgi:hypothetical protein